MVEGIAARRAAQNLSDAELEKLAEITSQMHKDDLPERQEKLNYEFHRAINIAGGTPKLLTVLHVLSKTMPARFFEIAGGWADIAGDQHRQIEAALRVRTAPRPSRRCTSTSCRVASTPWRSCANPVSGTTKPSNRQFWVTFDLR